MLLMILPVRFGGKYCTFYIATSHFEDRLLHHSHSNTFLNTFILSYLIILIILRTCQADNWLMHRLYVLSTFTCTFDTWCVIRYFDSFTQALSICATSTFVVTFLARFLYFNLYVSGAHFTALVLINVCALMRINPCFAKKKKKKDKSKQRIAKKQWRCFSLCFFFLFCFFFNRKL